MIHVAGGAELNYRKLVEMVIGRSLKSFELVHHIDGNHYNNKIDNLYIYDSNSKHIRYHIKVSATALGLLNCEDNNHIIRYVKGRIFPLRLKSNVHKYMCENKGSTC